MTEFRTATQRDHSITAELLGGKTVREVAYRFGLGTYRVRQIATAHGVRLTPDGERAQPGPDLALTPPPPVQAPPEQPVSLRAQLLRDANKGATPMVRQAARAAMKALVMWDRRHEEAARRQDQVATSQAAARRVSEREARTLRAVAILDEIRQTDAYEQVRSWGAEHGFPNKGHRLKYDLVLAWDDARKAGQ